MAYFPMFVELKGKNILVVGGGSVALRKCEVLLRYGAELTAVSAQLTPKLVNLKGVRLLFRPFDDADVEGRDMVVAATDSSELNARVAGLCKARGIAVNVVDDATAGSFLFPAATLRGRFSAGICTGGASPTAAAYFNRALAESLPDALEDILDFMAEIRPRVLKAVPDQSRRARIFAFLFTAALENGGEPDEDFVLSVVPELAEADE